jgi:protease-4
MDDYPNSQYENTPHLPPSCSACPPPAPSERSRKSGFLSCFLVFGGIVFFFAVLIAAAIGGLIFLFNLKGEPVESQLTINGQRFDQVTLSGSGYSDNKILLIPVNGVIVGRVADSFGSSSYLSADHVCALLEEAMTNDNIRAVVLRIDSPGGEVVAADRIYRTVLAVREAGIPVVAQMESLAASGGYYIAAGCDYIIANPMTTTGSIGVIMSAVKYYDLMQKIGVQTENYTSGKMKDMLSGSRPTSPEEKALVQRHIDRVYEEFVRIVAEGRKELTVEGIKNGVIGDGRIFLGTQALELKLVDALGYNAEAEAKAAELAGIDHYQVISLRRGFSLKNLLFEVLSSTRQLDVRLPGDNSLSLEAGKLYFLPAFNQ